MKHKLRVIEPRDGGQPVFTGLLTGCFALTKAGPPNPVSEVRDPALQCQDEISCLQKGTLRELRRKVVFSSHSSGMFWIQSAIRRKSAVRIHVAIEIKVKNTKRWSNFNFGKKMNDESDVRQKKGRVQIQDSAIFLSACMSGHKDEVDDLLAKGADINTSTVDGVTALHESIIDRKPEMVRFLCNKSADVNAQDCEGWTPLHIAACCGNLAIVKYLCQNKANLQIITSDKKLPVDLARNKKCRVYLEQEYKRRGINPKACRDKELNTMLKDANKWLADRNFADRPHPETGATAIHVAAVKGYTQLLKLMIRAGGNVKAQDKDGWTPLHAAAHWAERYSCKILMQHGARVSDLSFAGENVLAVADENIYKYLEELDRVIGEKKKSPSMSAERPLI